MLPLLLPSPHITAEEPEQGGHIGDTKPPRSEAAESHTSSQPAWSFPTLGFPVEQQHPLWGVPRTANPVLPVAAPFLCLHPLHPRTAGSPGCLHTNSWRSRHPCTHHPTLNSNFLLCSSRTGNNGTPKHPSGSRKVHPLSHWGVTALLTPDQLEETQHTDLPASPHNRL